MLNYKVSVGMEKRLNKIFLERKPRGIFLDCSFHSIDFIFYVNQIGNNTTV